MQPWEYCYVPDIGAAPECTAEVSKELNRLGSEGWELVSVLAGTAADARGARLGFFFKRPALTPHQFADFSGVG